MTDLSVSSIIEENRRRHALIDAPFDPVAGDASDSGRVILDIPGLSDCPLYIPRTMETETMVATLRRCGSLDAYIDARHHTSPNDNLRELARREFTLLRVRHDFPFWAASFVYIKPKGMGGRDVLFTLNRPQRRLVALLEEMRIAGQPIRLIILKARQWGGSTCVQLYMAWLQLVHAEGLNSLIVAHQSIATSEIKDMFDRMLRNYPDWLLRDSEGNVCTGRRMENVGTARGTFRVGIRNFKVRLGSAERPDSCRGGDYNLVHLSEVGLWPDTVTKSPELLMRSACSGVLLQPMTMIVFESTANGSETFFHREYKAAKEGRSQFKAYFVPWYEIDGYSLPLRNPGEFAARLLERREESKSNDDREQPGAYLWRLWESGATLEAINWFVSERMKYSDHGNMASEYPSDDVEAFAFSGSLVFDRYRVEKLALECRAPAMRGEIDGDRLFGEEALDNVRFNPDEKGGLMIWKDRELPEEGWRMSHRYLAVVDIGGRSDKADWSVILVIDRIGIDCGERPEVVAQWRGHIDMDLLAWKAARIAKYYDNALLVIESNTLETHDPQRWIDGDQTSFILNQLRDVYPNLYYRMGREDSVSGQATRRYGFHTNSATKPMVISALVQAVRENAYVERDRGAIGELLTYEQHPNGSFGALPGCHDDMLMTRAIGLHVSSREMPPPKKTPTTVSRRDFPYSAAYF